MSIIVIGVFLFHIKETETIVCFRNKKTINCISSHLCNIRTIIRFLFLVKMERGDVSFIQ